MRAALALLATLGLVAGCVDRSSQPVTSTAPTVSYRITGNDVSQANANAAAYCQRYGQAAQFQGIQSTGSGNLAVYSCSGGVASGAPPQAAPLVGSAGSTLPPGIQCADMFHQDRPGGTDYQGPPVPECPPTR